MKRLNRLNSLGGSHSDHYRLHHAWWLAVKRVCRDYSITIDEFDRSPENYMPTVEDLFRICNRISTVSNRDDCGLMIGKHLSFRSLSPLIGACLFDTDLRVALWRLVHHQNFFSDGVAIIAMEDSGELRLVISFVGNKNDKCAKESLMILFLRLINEFYCGKDAINRIEVPSNRMAVFQQQEIAKELEFFKTEETYAIRLDIDKISKRESDFCKKTSYHFSQELLCISQNLSQGDLVGRVREAILSVLPETLNQDQVADMFGFNTRTFQRRLSQQGSSYRIILEQTRKDIASNQLVIGDSIDLISDRLGFSDSSNFSRAFKNWYGIPPSEFIRRMT